MTAVLSTERIAIEALERASREHTTQAVRLLAKHYGFDPDEALVKVGLRSAPLTTEGTPAKTPPFRHNHLSSSTQCSTEVSTSTCAPKPSRDDVVQRLLKGDDPVPVLSSDEDSSSDTRHAPKPRLTAQGDKPRSAFTGVTVVTRTTEPHTRYQVKMPKKAGGGTVGTYNTEAEAAAAYEAQCLELDYPYERLKKAPQRRKVSCGRPAPSQNRLAQNTAVKVMKAALKALKTYDKEASKAAKDAGKAHKVLLKKANLDAAKATRAALKSIKVSVKDAARHAKVKSPKKSPQVAVTPNLADVPQVDAVAMPAEPTVTSAVPAAEEDDELEEEALNVEICDVGGTTYYRSASGSMFDLESSDPVGRYDFGTGKFIED